MNKDWTGNSKTTFTTLGASSHSEHDREENDYYATEPRVIKELFDVETFDSSIWECACGEGHLSKEMQSLGKLVKSTDLVYRGFGVGEIDFLNENDKWNGDIITNPPYKFAQEFVEHSVDLINDKNKVAMFLKLTFLEGQARRKMFEKYPPKVIYVYSQRRKCAINGKFEDTGSSAAAYAWFVWEKGFSGEPIIKWI
jgi:hypothetical protein